jgi:multidrug efflux pump subunit AcrA (membrane-fusion protein)
VLRPDHTVALRSINVDAMDGDRVAVTSGLQPGETVVTNPPTDLSEGAKVETETSN